MKMREEIDALATMGLDPVEVLILPRIIALIVALPILAFLGSMAALYGGGLIAWLYGGMSPASSSRVAEAVRSPVRGGHDQGAVHGAGDRHHRLQRGVEGKGSTKHSSRPTINNPSPTRQRPPIPTTTDIAQPIANNLRTPKRPPPPPPRAPHSPPHPDARRRHQQQQPATTNQHPTAAAKPAPKTAAPNRGERNRRAPDLCCFVFTHSSSCMFRRRRSG